MVACTCCGLSLWLTRTSRNPAFCGKCRCSERFDAGRGCLQSAEDARPPTGKAIGQLLQPCGQQMLTGLATGCSTSENACVHILLARRSRASDPAAGRYLFRHCHATTAPKDMLMPAQCFNSSNRSGGKHLKREHYKPARRACASTKYVSCLQMTAWLSVEARSVSPSRAVRFSRRGADHLRRLCPTSRIIPQTPFQHLQNIERRG